jgi:hypothetical protein
MLASLCSLWALTGMALAAYGLGWPIARWLRMRREDRLACAVWTLALGLLAGGMLLTVWGLAGGLSVKAICVATWLSAAAGACMSVASATGVSRPVTRPWLRSELALAPPAWLSRGLLLLTALAAAAALLSALAPTVAGDALCYHLELPKLFLAQGRIVYLPFHDNSTFPLLGEMLYLWVLALDSPVAAQLVHWGLGLLLGGAAVLLATPIVGRPWAWLVGCVTVLVPGVTNQMSAPLNDVALAAFTTLALVAWRQALEDGEASQAFVLSGLMAGVALGTKYVAILFAAAVGLTWCWSVLQGPRRGALLRGAAIVAIVALAVSSIWYVRAAYHRGNPVFPFFSHWLGGGGPPAMRESKTPLKWTAASVVTSPWQVTMHPERFGGRGHQLGALFLATLPAVFLVRRRGILPLLAIAAAYWLLWYGLRQNVRFLFPLISLLSLVAVCVWIELARWPRAPRLLASGACGVLLIFSAMIPIARAGRHVPVALGFETRDDFLTRHEPTYQAAQFAKEHLPADARILSQEHRAFYFQQEIVRENVFRRLTAYPNHCSAPGDLVGLLREAGFTHVLLAEAEGPGVRYNDTLSRWADTAERLQPSPLTTLREFEFRDAHGETRRYRIAELRR